MMDPDYDLFMAIVATGSLTGAGRSLRISPAMASKRLSRLETRLGTRLVHRSTRRLALTAQGERFHADLEGIMAALAQAERSVAGDVEAPGGPLRISAPTSFGRLHLAPHVGAFLSAHPRVDFMLDLSDDFIDLMAGTVDLAIRITADVPPGLTAHHLADNARVLCAAPAYIAAHGTPQRLAELAGHRLLAATGQLPWRLSGPRGTVLHHGVSHVRTNSSEVVRELALSGVGIALRSLWDVHGDLDSGALVRMLPDFAGAQGIAIYAVHPPMPHMPPALAAFIQFLKGLYSPVPPWDRQR
ncbi:LysR family transcriptional regulator [Sphingobium algorifonticola]|uniref:LysR family transcriptional regulator n=1 Tax=Sphingobium algorifonticola TaxID=2008318 RepID=A0A437J658_9SPHN|nr:LysR family transcriptional regulator [Sphingobium algorifonticola]RVT40663.1 LysR family transcriptional regulator [Sphingobium algorifonticola]